MGPCCRPNSLGNNLMWNFPTTPNLNSERISVALFYFSMNIAKIRTGESWNVGGSANPAARILLFSRLGCSMALHSLKMHFAITTSAAFFLAAINLTRPCAAAFRKNMAARMVPFHVASMAERHDVFGQIISPISIYMMNLEALFCFAELATGAKKALSRRLGEGLSFAIFFRSKVFVPATHFHGRTISATAGVCPG